MALVIFVITYAVIGIGSVPGLNVNRPTAALVGAIAMVLAKVVGVQEAWHAVDLETLGLLFGLMLLAGTLADAGFFDAVIDGLLRVATRAGRAPSAWILLAATVVASGVLSALFLNDAVCILFTPLVLVLAKRVGRNPLPFLLAVATASNVGGACTITGNPQNALIGTTSDIGWGEFALRLLPASVLGLAATFGVIALVYRRALSSPAAGEVTAAPAREIHRVRLAVACVCALGLLAAFLLRVDIAMAALAAGATASVFAGPRGTGFRGVDFATLVLFAGLFVVTEGVRVSGLTASITGSLAPALAAGSWTKVTRLSGIALVLSNVVSNVPAVMLLAPTLSAAGSTKAWLALAMSSTFAGNLTLVGSVANLIVAELARRECPISFVEYLKVGVPITLITTGIGIVVLAIQPIP